MKYEYYRYQRIKNHDQLKIIYNNIPLGIKEELIDYRRFQPELWIEKSKKDIISYLDNHYRQYIKNLDCIKCPCLEIDEQEIDHYTHFQIIPDSLQMGSYMSGSFLRPTCPVDGCFVTMRLLNPLRIRLKKAKKIGIGHLVFRNKKTVLFISAHLKNLFDSAGVTGLEYEPMLFDDRDMHEEYGISPPFVARIQKQIASRGDEIYRDDFLCPEHRIVNRLSVRNSCIARDGLPEDDFLEVDRLCFEGEVYNYRANEFMVSRKVLKILLDNKIKGLYKFSFFLDKPFEPIMFDDMLKNY